MSPYLIIIDGDASGDFVSRTMMRSEEPRQLTKIESGKHHHHSTTYRQAKHNTDRRIDGRH